MANTSHGIITTANRGGLLKIGKHGEEKKEQCPQTHPQVRRQPKESEIWLICHIYVMYHELLETNLEYKIEIPT